MGAGRAVVLAALLLGLFIPTWTATAEARPPEQATSARANNPGHVKFAWLRIMAFTNAPVVGANVRIYLQSQHRPLIEVPAATNNQGVLPVAVRSALFQSHSRIRVIVSGGTTNGNPFLGRLSADVVLTDPAYQIVVVNLVTTLVSLLMEARPSLKLEDARSRVRSFLGLPAGYDLGLALRQSSGYSSPFFSPTLMLAAAQRAGGLDDLEAELVQELTASPAAKHPFFNPTPKAPGGAASFVAKNLAAGVLKAIGGDCVGWVVQASGRDESGVTSGDIDSLQQGLADLQSSVDALSSQVAQLTLLVQSTATQEQYNTIVVPAQALATEVTDVENRLQYFAQECPPFPEGSKPPTPSNYCTTEQAAITDELNDITIFSSYDVLESYVEDNPATGFSGMLHLYSLWLGQSRDFFRAADSTKMQNLYDYWDTVLTSAANLRVELLHQEGEQDQGGTQLIALMGNPDSNPPTTGTFQANQDANLKLMFPPVPPGTVICTADRTMWALSPSRIWNTVLDPDGSCDNSCSWKPLPLGMPDNNIPPYDGFSDWLAQPSKAMWEAAVSRAPANTTWGPWLNSETLANSPDSPTSPGFLYQCENGSTHFYWTSTIASYYGYDETDPFGWIVSMMTNNWTQQPWFADEFCNVNYPVRTLKPGEQYYWYK